jgi:hypothetical protein
MKNPIKGHYDTKRLKWGNYPLRLSSQGQKRRERKRQGKKKKTKVKYKDWLMYRCKFENQKIESPNNQIIKYWVPAAIADSLPVRQ